MKLEMRSIGLEARQASNDYCNWEAGLATVVDDKLYISSGVYRSTQNVKKPIADFEGIHSVVRNDLSTKTKIESLSRSTVAKPKDLLSLRNGAVWSSEKSGKIYEFGGMAVDENQRSNLDDLKYGILDTKTNKWETKDLPEKFRRYTGGYTQGDGKGFYYKGKATKDSTPGTTNDTYPSGMLVFDFDKEEFESVPGDPNAPKELTYPTLAYAPFGEEGIVMSMGGLGFESTGGLVSYDEVSVYDIKNKEWYRQPTSGDRPSKRIGGCSVHATSPDSQSHQTFVYGGMEPNKDAYDDIYVLSVPSFTWQRVYNFDSNGGFPRINAACIRHRNNMITVGGTKPGDPSVCDKDAKRAGMNVFNLNTLSWTSDHEYESEDYKVADEIANFINGRKKPEGGWADPGLRDLFEVRKAGAADLDSSLKNIKTPGNKNSKAAKGKPAIIGAAVGGFLALLIIIAVIFSLLQKRKKSGGSWKKLKSKDHTDTSYNPSTQLPTAHTGQTPINVWAHENHQQQNTFTAELETTSYNNGSMPYPITRGTSYYDPHHAPRSAHLGTQQGLGDTGYSMTQYNAELDSIPQFPQVAKVGQAPVIGDPALIAEKLRREREASRGYGV